MKYIVYGAIAFFVVFNSVCLAADKGEMHIILGQGAISCGKFLVDKRNAAAEAQYLSWTLGYLSGINTVKGTRVGSGADAFAMMKHIENYCQKNPLNKFVEASDDLYEALWRKSI